MLNKPTNISGGWQFLMISWFSFGYHRKKLMAIFTDASNSSTVRWGSEKL